MSYKNPDRQREYQRKWCAARRGDFFQGKSCVRCGSTTSLELDHIDPREKITHRIWSFSADKREEEVAKCQVLCSACHKKKTAEDMKKYSSRDSGEVTTQGSLS